MKRFKNISMSIIGILLALIVSVCPRYYVYASSETPDQTVTSNDSIVQKLMDYTLSMWGAVYKSGIAVSPQGITKIGTDLQNTIKEKIATLMNGGGIYVDQNGNYVFTNEASQQIYDSMMANTNTDAKVISDFSNFTTFSDGYVNADYLAKCNELITWAKEYGALHDDYSYGNYILVAQRSVSGSNIGTVLFAYLLPDNFGFLTLDNSNISVISLRFKNISGNNMISIRRYASCDYSPNNGGSYSVSISSSGESFQIITPNLNVSYTSVDEIYNTFPYYVYNFSNVKNNYSCYCNNSIILSKSVPAGNSVLNQSSGIYSSYTNIGTVNKNTINNNNWENIYNNYVQQVNIEYQENPDMSADDLRKIMKKYTSTIVDAITQGTENIEETVSISNRYLQAISVDVRNISDKLDSIIENGGGSSSGGGLTEEQYNTLIGLINNINDHAVDIASDADGSYLELQDISDNSASTNTNLVAMKGVLDSINSKIRSRNEKPLPDPDFWDNLTDDLIDITDTVPEKFANAMTVIATAFKTVVPFGYIAVVGVLISSLAEDPEPPVFEITLDNDDGTIPLNWQGTIDLTWVDSIIPIVRALECIVFIIGLIVFTFTVFNTLGSLFS